MAINPTTSKDLTALYTTVRNISGTARRFGFLPPHGRRLDADEELTVFGNILDQVAGFDRVSERREQDALAKALDRGDLAIVHTPAPILQDQSNLDIQQLELDGNTLTTSAPSWESTAPSEEAIPA